MEVDTPSLRSALGSASGAYKVDVAVKSMGEGNPLGRLADHREIGKAGGVSRERHVRLHHGRRALADGGMAQA
jgi:hypothetical protein